MEFNLCYALVFLILVQTVLHAVNLFDNLSNKLFPKYILSFLISVKEGTGRWTWVGIVETQIETAVGGHQLQNGQAAMARPQL